MWVFKAKCGCPILCCGAPLHGSGVKIPRQDIGNTLWALAALSWRNDAALGRGPRKNGSGTGSGEKHKNKKKPGPPFDVPELQGEKCGSWKGVAQPGKIESFWLRVFLLVAGHTPSSAIWLFLLVWRFNKR